jgi:PST family polysaccharide transporter
LKNFIDYINKHVLVKLASLSNANVLTRIIAGILTSKAIAVFIGAEGLALIGNLRNFFSSVQSVATIGIYNGVVKYVSKFKNDANQLSKTISTTYYFGYFATCILAFLLFLNAETVNTFIFSTYNYIYVIKILALALPFYSLNMFCFSILNGFSKYKIMLIINIIGQILGLLVTLILIWQNNIDGALISVVVSPSLIFLITLVAIFNQRSLLSLIKIKKISLQVAKKLAPYAIMALVTTIALPIVFIIIRNYIGETIGLKEAGYWEAMNRISTYYLMFANSMLALYILPRFGRINDIEIFKQEVFKVYKVIIPVMFLGMLVIYFAKVYIIKGVFTDEFLPVKNLFLWQLLGDFIKVLCIILTYQFLAQKMFWHFIIIEAFFVLQMYLLSIFCIDNYGVVGVTIAHFSSYALQFAILLLIFSNSQFRLVFDKEEI